MFCYSLYCARRTLWCNWSATNKLSLLCLYVLTYSVLPTNKRSTYLKTDIWSRDSCWRLLEPISFGCLQRAGNHKFAATRVFTKARKSEEAKAYDSTSDAIWCLWWISDLRLLLITYLLRNRTMGLHNGHNSGPPFGETTVIYSVI